MGRGLHGQQISPGGRRPIPERPHEREPSDGRKGSPARRRLSAVSTGTRESAQNRNRQRLYKIQ